MTHPIVIPALEQMRRSQTKLRKLERNSANASHAYQLRTAISRLEKVIWTDDIAELRQAFAALRKFN